MILYSLLVSALHANSLKYYWHGSVQAFVDACAPAMLADWMDEIKEAEDGQEASYGSVYALASMVRLPPRLLSSGRRAYNTIPVRLFGVRPLNGVCDQMQATYTGFIIGPLAGVCPESFLPSPVRFFTEGCGVVVKRCVRACGDATKRCVRACAGTRLHEAYGLHNFAWWAGMAVICVAPIMTVNRKLGPSSPLVHPTPPDPAPVLELLFSILIVIPT